MSSTSGLSSSSSTRNYSDLDSSSTGFSSSSQTQLAPAAASLISSDSQYFIYLGLLVGVILLLLIALAVRFRMDAKTRERYAYESEFDVRKEKLRAKKRDTKARELAETVVKGLKAGVPKEVILAALAIEKKKKKRKQVEHSFRSRTSFDSSCVTSHSHRSTSTAVEYNNKPFSTSADSKKGYANENVDIDFNSSHRQNGNTDPTGEVAVQQQAQDDNSERDEQYSMDGDEADVEDSEAGHEKEYSSDDEDGEGESALPLPEILESMVDAHSMQKIQLNPIAIVSSTS